MRGARRASGTYGQMGRGTRLVCLAIHGYYVTYKYIARGEIHAFRQQTAPRHQRLRGNSKRRRAATAAMSRGQSSHAARRNRE